MDIGRGSPTSFAVSRMGGSVDDDDIENALAGIGSDWEPLDWLPPEGAMAIAGLAIHCRATSPTMTVHVKVYLPVGPDDPPPCMTTSR